ncbi:MAG: c-type cytochrome biogenesis protein CcmI [Inquilinaceae bacterium]
MAWTQYLLWIAVAAMTAATVLAVLHPLMRRRRSDTAEDPGLAVYRDQMAEIERDRARGLIDDTEAEAARLEVSRRVLAVADRTPSEPAAPSARQARASRVVAIAMAAIIPAAALTLYLSTGAPSLPSQPYAARDPGPRLQEQALRAEIETLQRRLEAAPDDLAGWVALARGFDALGLWEDAAGAYARAVGLSEGDAALTGSYGEALVRAGDGTVTEQARLAFERTVAARPGDPRARYYLALARAQAGADRDALEGWQALAADSPPDAPWLPLVRQRIAETAARLGIEVEIAAPAEPGPGPADIEAAAEMTEADRQRMIRGMVDGLAARLEDAPDDLEGWLRLGRSYAVLGERDEAVTALRRAAALAPEDPDVLSALADALLDPAGAAPAELTDETVEVLRRLSAIDPDNARALFFLGLHAAAQGDTPAAERMWRRLLDRMTPGSPEHNALSRQIEALSAS